MADHCKIIRMYGLGNMEDGGISPRPVNKFKYWILLVFLTVFAGCADSSYWSRINTIDEMLRHPTNAHDILISSPLNIIADNDTLRSITNMIYNGNYYYSDEYQGYKVNDYTDEKGFFHTSSRQRCHIIIISDRGNNYDDISFYFEENNNTWRLTGLFKRDILNSHFTHDY